ncbi:MAG: hypothetical protein GDA40_10940 [Rhodobacteraceae bacterium]|nr:hypothetical protein [Paracoccaceae bacterium]
MGTDILFAAARDIKGFDPAMGPFCKEGGASLHCRAEVGAWGASGTEKRRALSSGSESALANGLGAEFADRFAGHDPFVTVQTLGDFEKSAGAANHLVAVEVD